MRYRIMRDYTKAEDRARAHALYDNLRAAAKAERTERYAGVVRIERGPAAYRVTFPKLTAAERGTPEARAAWHEARRPMADVKAIIGRRFDAVQGAWIVPLDMAQSVECLALDYGATIEEAAADIPAELAARVAELERRVATLTAERDAALKLADEYAAMLDGQAVAA